MSMQLKQTYKNRAEAFRLFIQAQNLPIGQTKFYNDAERLRLARPDKTIELSALMAYVKDELQIDPTTGQSLVEKEHSKTLAQLELDEKRLRVAKLEREGRKDDHDWLHRDTVHEREGALIGRIMDEVLYQMRHSAAAVITVCKGDPARRIEVEKQLENAVFDAFRAILDAGEVDITFESEEEREQ